MLSDKKLLITGVITRDSIAWEAARQAQEAGAEVLFGIKAIETEVFSFAGQQGTAHTFLLQP